MKLAELAQIFGDHRQSGSAEQRLKLIEVTRENLPCGDREKRTREAIDDGRRVALPEARLFG